LLVTSSIVIARGTGGFWRHDQRRAIQFLSFVHELPKLEIASFDGRDVIQAGLIVRKFSDQPLTLADAHGIVI